MIQLLVQFAVAAPPDGADGPPPTEPLVSEEPVQEAPLTPPQILDFVQAPYPQEALDAGVEAVVRVLITIDETGLVTDAQVLQPVGYGFDDAAAEALRQSTFQPASTPDGPVPVQMEFAYGFEIPEPPAPEDLPVNLDGSILEKGSRMPVPNAIVTVEGTELSTRTDAEGRWALKGAPLGAIALKIAGVGYGDETIEVDVVEGQVTTVEAWLRNRGLNENEIVGVYERPKPPAVTRRTITVEEVKTVPGTFGDPVRVIQNLGGAARSSFGTGELILRGANPEDSRVFVDGVEVPIVFHLGGYRSVVNSAFVESVDYMPGGYPTKYGRGTGGVVDIVTRDTVPDRWTLKWRTDFLDTGLHLAGPVSKDKKTGLSVSARRSYLDAWLPLVLPEDSPTVAPWWTDYQIKLARENEWSVFLFGYQDRLDLVVGDEGAADTQSFGLENTYGAHRLVFKRRWELDEGLIFKVQPFIGYDNQGISLGSALESKSQGVKLGLRSQLEWTKGAVTLVPGIDFQGGWFDQSAGIPASQNVDDPLAPSENFELDSTGWEVSPDAFVDVRVQPLANRDQLMILGGVRLNSVIYPGAGSRMSVDPRVQMAFLPVPRTRIAFGTGLYQQRPQSPIGGDQLVGLQYERSWSSEVTFEQQFSDAASIELTGFMRRMDQRAVNNPDLVNPFEDDVLVSGGTGRVHGMEMIARLKPIGRASGWVSYTLSRSERKDDPTDPDAEWVLFDFDQTHIATVVGAYRFPYDFVLSSRFQYVTGNPYTSYESATYDLDAGIFNPVESAKKNGARLGDYWAFDVRVAKTFTFKRWKLEAFVDLLNLLHGENPEALQYNYDFTESTTISGLPTIPSLGFEATFAF